MKIGGIVDRWLENSLALYGDTNKQIESFSEYLYKAKDIDDINTDPWQALREKYPDIVYYAGDIEVLKNLDPFRQDFPVSKLFEENPNIEELSLWKPKTKNPPSGFEDYIQADRARIPKGKRAIMIHPDVKDRMEKDPKYAKEILNKVDTFMQKDIMIEEELVPGCTLGMSQFVAIDKEGKIADYISVSWGASSYEEPYQNNITPSLIWKMKDLVKDTNIKFDIASIFPDYSLIQTPVTDDSHYYQMGYLGSLWEIWKKSRLLNTI